MIVRGVCRAVTRPGILDALSSSIIVYIYFPVHRSHRVNAQFGHETETPALTSVVQLSSTLCVGRFDYYEREICFEQHLFWRLLVAFMALQAIHMNDIRV